VPFLSRVLKLNPGGVAVRTRERTVTYRELTRRAEEVAEGLRGAGVRPGMTVALEADLHVGFLVGLHGIWRAGATAAPLSQAWTPGELARALELLGPAFLLTPGREGDEMSCEPGVAFGMQEESAPSHVAAARLLTSGTAGGASVVELTFPNLRASARASHERLELGPEDRWLVSLSPAHVGGLALVTRAAYLGSSLVLAGRFDPGAFLELAAEGRVSHASLVPTMLRRTLEAPGGREAPPGLRCLLTGGAAAPLPLVLEALEAGYPVSLTYGLTEATSQVATAPPSLVREKPGTVGAPLPGVDLRLAADEEILVRGKTVAPAAAGEDGWLRTGDLGRLDEDGHLWVTGRLSDRIISGGVNVDPGEVAACLRTHPGVAEVAVVGVSDPEWGERVVALVVPGPVEVPGEEALRALTREALAPPKRPKEYRFQAALPLNPNGKVDRNAVRALFGEGKEDR
jgi:O-succinylbenzoic acid--CoA ligase